MEVREYSLSGTTQLHSHSAVIWKIIINHDASLYRICRKYMYTEADAEDAHSQLKIKLYCTLINDADRLGEVRSVSSWLCTIARNFCIDIYRKNQLYSERHDYTEPDVFFPAPLEESPAESVAGAEIYRQINLALYNLPPKQFDVAIRRLLWGQSYKQISHDLGISYCIARKRLQEARVVLRRSLARHAC